ncbi:lantibiotic dehydratase [Pedobacter namyangjuensis]|uniref:lantibiotic dehydratase n=1 Tax=Pedobacter namyangjuensis TaxID=600626 RepID=UPI000DE20127|nr:lantibiotic dehydratase [Pedobacter namyangjuensis]
MKIQLHDTIICRTPAFGVDRTLENSFELLKAKIKTASPSFFSLLEELSLNELHKFTEKAQFTLWKYFNRAKYRSTPYSTFAAITVLPLANDEEMPILNEQMESFVLPDWSEKLILANYITASSAKYFVSNSSYYFLDNEIRYIVYQQGQFQLSSVACIPELAALLILCRNVSSKETLLKLMQTCFDFNESSTIALLNQLISLQLLLCDLHPNITGTDYFERLDYKPLSVGHDYIIASRKLKKGSFYKNKLQHLSSFLNFACKNWPTPTNENMEHFKQQFNARFDQQEICLALALDPEAGIGYGNLAHDFNANPLVSELKNNSSTIINKRISYGNLHSFLLNKMMLGREILLEEFAGVTPNTPLITPNTISVLFELYKGNPVIYSAGGTSANALLGRFSLGDNTIAQLCKTMVAIEEKANEDVLFFDIAYQAEQRVDNVNRRLQLYNYELPLLTWSTHSTPLDLEDIMVSISSNEVILRSKKLGKRLIPRLATAYNYNRSDLAAFRFLCDLQHQNIRSNFGISLPILFPDLDFYPRVSYKGIIVSASKWLFKKSRISDANGIKSLDIDKVKQWLLENNIIGFFKVGDTDQTLTFNTKQEEDLLMFLTYAQQQNSDFYVTEGLYDEKDMVKDEHGALYHPQYIASYFHEERVYQKTKRRDKAKTEIESPGGEWLYFEIYAHPNQSNRLLQLIWKSFIKPHKLKLKAWFFIRYFDPKPHIRLRLQLKDAAQTFALMRLLRAILDTDVKSNLVNDIQLKTYYKEMERYGPKRMHLVEQFFSADSEFVIKSLKKYIHQPSQLGATLALMQLLVQNTFDDITEQLTFAKHLANSFAKELDIDQEGFKKINASFKQLTILPNLTPIQILPSYARLFGKLIEDCENAETKTRLLADLIHMHINRTFSIDQRVYEAILYQYLLRVLQQQAYTAKAK